MRDVNRIIIHCTATPEGRWHDVEDIRDWHVNGRGWSDIGYHFLVLLDGTVEEGRPLHRPGAHVSGHNADSIGIAYVGGIDEFGNAKDTMNEDQEIAMETLICDLRDEFGEEVTLHGHNEFSCKTCPSFIVAEKFSHLL